jgi:hypothetical protein
MRVVLGHAWAIRRRYQRLGVFEDLQTAMQKYQEALHLAPADFSQTPLAAVTRELQKAVDIIAVDHPYKVEGLQSLAACFVDLYQTLGDPENLQLAHHLYTVSFKQYTLVNPETSWNRASGWAALAEKVHPPSCLVAYSAAFDLLPEVIWIGHKISVRHDAIRRLSIGPMTANATKICVELSNLTLGVQIIEQGIATVFQQTYQLKPDVSALSPLQAKEFEELSSQLYNRTAADPTDVAIQRKELLDKIHKQPGLEYFLLPKPYTALCKASQEGPVVILNSHKDACDGIIILNPVLEPVHVALSSVTFNLLKSQQLMLRELLDCCNVRTREKSVSTRLFGHRERFTSKPVQECFAELLRWLWENIVEPVYQVLAAVRIDNSFRFN